MTQDNRIIGEHIFRLLEPYLEHNLAVHFKLHNGEWQNGNIVDLSFSKLTLVIKEFKQGIKPILLEDIKPESIKAFREKP